MSGEHVGAVMKPVKITILTSGPCVPDGRVYTLVEYDDNSFGIRCDDKAVGASWPLDRLETCINTFRHLTKPDHSPGDQAISSA
jgi:hypothetical protein